MRGIAYAVVALAIYVTSTVLGATDWITWILVLLLVGAGLCTVLGAVIAAGAPRTAALLLQAWEVITGVVVGAIGASLMSLAVSLAELRGMTPSPTAEVVIGACGAIAAAVVVEVTNIGARLSSAWFAKATISWRYGRRFSALPSGDRSQIEAYLAVNREATGISGIGPVTGWGLRATASRLVAIRRALQ